MMFDMDAGIASGLDAYATFVYGTDTLLASRWSAAPTCDDIYDATGFSGVSANAGSSGTFNEFEGGGGNDTITGNGNTRISYSDAGGGVTVNLRRHRLGSRLGRHRQHHRRRQCGARHELRRHHHRHAGRDILDGLGGIDTLNGSPGNDRFFGGGGNDTIDGGGDFDIAVRTGFRNQYTVAPGASPGQSTVTDINLAREGVDSLFNVELIEFSDAYQMNEPTLDISTLIKLEPGRKIIGDRNNSQRR